MRSSRPLSRLLVLALALVAAFVAGCAGPGGSSSTPPGSTTPATTPTPAYQALGFNGSHWPRLDGVTLTILDHGAFGAFEDAKKAFEARTGARVERVSADDAGGALNRAVLEKGAPTFDVVYGIDNVLWTRAVEEGIFEPYTPLLAPRVDARYVFFDAAAPWPATPVDHGYVAVNVDRAALGGASVETLDDVKAYAARFVTEDPRTSSPGLGYLLATIATFPEDAEYSWQDHWRDLFAGGVLVTSGWSEAYEQHFSGGYGPDYGGLGDRALVTSYTTSPAYEAYFERPAEKLASVVLAPNATFHQVETMGIAKGTRNLAAAQAWIEFSLTPEFQSLLAPGMAVYPVVSDVSADETFGEHDPEPGSFEPAALDAQTIGANIERWLAEWTALCEAADCA